MGSRVGRRSYLRGIGCVTAIGLAGCLGGESVGREIKLGLLMGTTGAFEQLGPPIRDAAQLVADQINDADTGFSVDVRFEDSASEPTQGAERAQHLVDEGYPMVCGALSGRVTARVARDVAVPAGVAMCSPATTSPEISDIDDDDLLFRTPRTDALQGRMLAKITARRLDHDTAATIFRDGPSGREIAAGFTAAFEDEYDGTSTAAVSYTPNASSYADVVERARQDDPGAIILVGYPQSAVQLFEDLHSVADPGNLAVLVSDGLQSSSLPDQVGTEMTGVGGTAPRPEGPGFSAFQSLYTSAYGSDGTAQAYVRESYDAAATLALANAAAGENEGSAVAASVRPVTAGGGEVVAADTLVEGLEMAARGESIEYRGVSGPVTFDENGDLASANYDYFEFTEGGIEVRDRVTI